MISFKKLLLLLSTASLVNEGNIFSSVIIGAELIFSFSNISFNNSLTFLLLLLEGLGAFAISCNNSCFSSSFNASKSLSPTSLFLEAAGALAISLNNSCRNSSFNASLSSSLASNLITLGCLGCRGACCLNNLVSIRFCGNIVSFCGLRGGSLLTTGTLTYLTL